MCIIITTTLSSSTTTTTTTTIIIIIIIIVIIIIITTTILIINKLMVVFFYLAFILSLNKLSCAVLIWQQVSQLNICSTLCTWWLGQRGSAAAGLQHPLQFTVDIVGVANVLRLRCFLFNYGTTYRNWDLAAKR